MLNIPNSLTLLRVLLIPVFVISLMDLRYGWSFVVFVVAGVTDAVDGGLARMILRAIPSWLAVIVITRDVIISLGFCLLFLMDHRPEAKPTTFSKVNTVTQVLTIAVVLFSKVKVSFSCLVPVLIWATAITTILTGLQYIYLGIRMSNGANKRNRR
jgi:cardiolipin synthase